MRDEKKQQIAGKFLAAILLTTGLALGGCAAKGPSPQQLAAEQADQAAARAEAAALRANQAAERAEDAADKAEAIFKKNVQK